MTKKPLKVYVAGKVSKNSVFGTHDWRSAFCGELERFSGRPLVNLDPTKSGADQKDTLQTFGCDAYMIKHADVVVVYLSDDISIGGSQEILIAKYFAKPVVGLAPLGGKFNGSDKEYFDRVVKDYKDPFVFSTCDVVCQNAKETGEALASLEQIQPKQIELIDNAVAYYKQHFLAGHDYVRAVTGDGELKIIN